MRGDIFLSQTPEPVTEKQPVASTGPEAGGQDNVSENMKAAKKGSIWFWTALLALYFIWDYVQSHAKIKESLEPKNIRANFHNLAIIGIGAAVFINGMNVLLTKLASMRIPLLSKAAGSMLPLFNL
jgi:hypothetical protein